MGPSFLLSFELGWRTSGGQPWSGWWVVAPGEPSPWVWLRDGDDRLFHAVSVWELSPEEDGPTAQCGPRVLVVSLFDEPAGGWPLPGLRRRCLRFGGARRGTRTARAWVIVGAMTSSDPVPIEVSRARRRARADAARSESVRVRLTPEEAAVVGEAAARVGASVGAWVGDTAVGRARAEAAGDEPKEAGGAGLSSWRELVAALVALRAEVAATRHAAVVARDSAALAGTQLDGQPCSGTTGNPARHGVIELLQRIDAMTATAVEVMLSGARCSSTMERSGQP